MAKEREIMEEDLPGEEMAVTETTEEMPAVSAMSHTTDEIPELAGKGVGDTITFRIDNVSDDGVTYSLAVVGEEMTPETAGEGAAAIQENFVA